MENLNARSLYQALSSDRCAFGYSGSFQDDHTARLIELGEALIADQKAGPSASSRLGYVMVEAYQNIIRHREESADERLDVRARSLFILKCQDGAQQVVTINPVKEEQGRKVDGLLTEIQEKNGTELKQLFLSGLQHAAGKDMRGAGLGLIEMARRSGNGPAWALHPIDHGLELFVLSIRLGTADGKERILAEAMELHDMVVRGRIRMFHTGPRPTAVCEAIEKLIFGEYPSEKDKVGKGHTISAALRLMPSMENGSGVGLIILSQEEDRLTLRIGSMMTDAHAKNMRDGVAGPTGIAEVLHSTAEAVSFTSKPMDESHLGLLTIKL